jgi:glyoxylase-like metal-dependent hydrolase (beta-lactamase superfamily II)
MFDCGIHPGLRGEAALPYLDSDYVNLSTVDVALITHFHLDHCAAVPYLANRTPFKASGCRCALAPCPPEPPAAAAARLACLDFWPRHAPPLALS